jgi:hypothetical protein
MGKTSATKRRRSSRRPERRPLMFPAQRQAAREKAATLALISEKLTGKPAKQDRRLPRPVVWLLWLGGAALASVLIGFALGLTRPRSRAEGQI